MGTDATTEAWGGRADAVLREVTAGVEVTRRRWDARTELAMRSYAPQASVPGVEIRSAGIFADWRHPVDAHLTLEAGGRLDVVGSRADASTANTALYLAYHGTRSTSRNDVLPSGRARLAWQTGAWQLGAGVGHAARVAEGNERFFALQRMGTDWVGNPTLGPSRHTGLEARVGWTRRGAAVDAQVFTGWIDGYVAVYDQARLRPQPGIMNAWARTYTNTDAQLTGAEVNGSAPLGHGLFLSGDVSHVRGSHAAVPIRGIAASPLAEMPALRARARLRFDDGRWFGGVEEVVTADQRRVDASLGEAPTPGAAITHLSGGRRWRAVTVTAGVTNLFDRFYVDALSYLRDPFRSGARLPEPGRQWFATLTWRP
jgi:iron complex outermembrane receptor protein